MKKKLILFTRYPVAGHTKTRLIPALGPEGAADLQRLMTERTLRTAENLTAEFPPALEIRHSGGSIGQMKDWLGPDRIYREQGDGDLGEKMARAMAEAFQAGYRQVMVIGADCPGLSPEILASGFSRLADHSLVLGPATDGGYYLLGLTRPCPELFSNRSWGGNLLLAETMSAAKKLALKFYLLKELADVDRPEDLKHLGDYPNSE
ncbi:MAG: TIGR04282 family arsenosugar biosynthesis glycosyltransferase [Thermodesulfobacteriota bacterium]